MEPYMAFILYSLAVCFSLTSANELPVGTLYAYGQNISGLPLFYADGVALLGYGHPKDVSTAVNVTFHLDDTTTTLTSSPNDTALAANWSTPVLYVNTKTGSFDPAGFVSSSNNTYTTTGFKFWGRILIWVGESEDGSVGRSFWAAPRGNDGTWSLLWNSDNAASDSAVPVVLKRQPPPSVVDE